jgi:hypothetical protein
VRHFQIYVLVALAVSGAACAKAQAQITPAELPVLSPPPPPPRIVEAYVDEPVPSVAPNPVDTAFMEAPSSLPARPPITKPEPPKIEPERTEPERPIAAPPALTLKPVAGAEAKTEASIRGLLNTAARDLQRVNYAALDGDGRAQFDIAKRFMQQAEDALKGGNLAFAGKLADKAATMAAVLVR